MSAYVVNDSTIDKIVNQIRYVQSYGSHRSPSNPGFVVGFNLNSDEACRQLGQQLQSMNVAAVNARYPNDTSESEPYTYTSGMPVPMVSLYKALRCYLYQCTEGDVPESDLFKSLTEWFDDIAHWIVQHSDNFEKAEWG